MLGLAGGAWMIAVVRLTLSKSFLRLNHSEGITSNWEIRLANGKERRTERGARPPDMNAKFNSVTGANLDSSYREVPAASGCSFEYPGYPFKLSTQRRQNSCALGHRAVENFPRALCPLNQRMVRPYASHLADGHR